MAMRAVSATLLFLAVILKIKLCMLVADGKCLESIVHTTGTPSAFFIFAYLNYFVKQTVPLINTVCSIPKILRAFSGSTGEIMKIPFSRVASRLPLAMAMQKCFS